MNIILTILSIFFIFIFAHSQYIKYRRFKHAINLKRSYDKMEMYFVNNQVALNKDYLEFLKIFKGLSLNPDYLDIQILTISKIATQRSGDLTRDTAWFDKTLKSLGADFEIIFKEFDSNSNELIKLSFYKPDLIIFIIKMLCKYALKSGAISFKRVVSEYDFIKNNEGAIVYSSNKLAY